MHHLWRRRPTYTPCPGTRALSVVVDAGDAPVVVRMSVVRLTSYINVHIYVVICYIGTYIMWNVRRGTH